MNPSDDRNDNDVMEMELPVALSRDDMDGEETLVTKHYQLLQFRLSMVENIHLTVVMQPVSEFGKKTTQSQRLVTQIGGTPMKVLTIHQRQEADSCLHSEEQTATVGTGHH